MVHGCTCNRLASPVFACVKILLLVCLFCCKVWQRYLNWVVWDLFRYNPFGDCCGRRSGGWYSITCKCWDGCPMITPANGSLPQTTPRAAVAGSLISQLPLCLCPSWICGSLVLLSESHICERHIVIVAGCMSGDPELFSVWREACLTSAGHVGVCIIMQHSDASCEDARIIIDRTVKVL